MTRGSRDNRRREDPEEYRKSKIECWTQPCIQIRFSPPYILFYPIRFHLILSYLLLKCTTCRQQSVSLSLPPSLLPHLSLSLPLSLTHTRTISLSLPLSLSLSFSHKQAYPHSVSLISLSPSLPLSLSLSLTHTHAH